MAYTVYVTPAQAKRIGLYLKETTSIRSDTYDLTKNFNLIKAESERQCGLECRRAQLGRKYESTWSNASKYEKGPGLESEVSFLTERDKAERTWAAEMTPARAVKKEKESKAKETSST